MWPKKCSRTIPHLQSCDPLKVLLGSSLQACVLSPRISVKQPGVGRGVLVHLCLLLVSVPAHPLAPALSITRARVPITPHFFVRLRSVAYAACNASRGPVSHPPRALSPVFICRSTHVRCSIMTSPYYLSLAASCTMATVSCIVSRTVLLAYCCAFLLRALSCRSCRPARSLPFAPVVQPGHTLRPCVRHRILSSCTFTCAPCLRPPPPHSRTCARRRIHMRASFPPFRMHMLCPSPTLVPHSASRTPLTR
ncbi:hypothetical protein DENSPDRAFT_562855 [Dentipellis sp. KUC8613]|nr:hypothetical protein DENSPDRAFT_562855 [Dentipellis sp. KUC8613]